jgi:hypothetical protein
MKDELETYGDEGIASKDAPVPTWLKLTYIILPLWGILAFWIYWNGSSGWLDRGYWQQLQRAANTTMPRGELHVSPHIHFSPKRG